MAAAVGAGVAGCEQRGGDVRRALGGDVGDDAALIFVGADIVDRHLALGAAARAARRWRLRPAAVRRRIAPSAPARRCRAAAPGSSRSVPGPQMHPRLEGVAVDGVEHVDRMPHRRVAGAPPDRLGLAVLIACGSGRPRPVQSSAAPAASCRPRRRARTPRASIADSRPRQGEPRASATLIVRFWSWGHIPTLARVGAPRKHTNQRS